MKKQTVAQEARYYFNDIKHRVKKGESDFILYMSGTSNKRTRLYKENAKYEDDAKIDYKLGIISKEEYEIEIKSVRIFERSLANFKIF